MTNDINFLTGIQDPDLQLDQDWEKATETTDEGVKIIHLIKIGECRCPVCGRFMSKNGFCHRPVTVTALSIAGTRTVLKIRKQQYICKPSASCHKTINKVAEIKASWMSNCG